MIASVPAKIYRSYAPDAEDGTAADAPAPRPCATTMQAVAAASHQLLSVSNPARIYAALVEGARALPFCRACAVLGEFMNGAMASLASLDLTAQDEQSVSQVCGASDVRETLRAAGDFVTVLPASGERGPRGLAIVPIPNANPSTFLIALSIDDRPAGPEALDALRALAAIAASALQTAAARELGARRAERFHALHEVGVALSRELDLDGLYAAVYREIARVLKVDAFYIALWDPERQIISFPYSRDRGKCDIPNETGLTDGPCSWVIRNGRPIVVTDQDRGVQDSGNTFGSGEVSRSALHVPMLIGDRVLGVMSTQSYEPDMYAEEDLHLFQMMAGQTAVAVENARLYRALHDLSLADDLTGLPNRRAGMTKLKEELALAGVHGYPVSILMLDLDHFKRVNDTFGHGTGDDVLCEAAALLRGAIRSQDTLARWGGEEFILLLPRTDHQGAANVAEHLRATVAGFRFLEGRVPLTQTISLGGLSVPGGDQTPVHRVLEAVDACLYRAKEEGRNRVVMQARNAGAGF